MKKVTTLAACFAAAALTLAGCTKTDITPAGSVSETVSYNASVPDLSKCKIRRIYQEHVWPGVLQTALFSYNKAGNPYSVIYANSGTAYPNHFFIYDNLNRLKEYRLLWSGYLHEHHFYRHNSQNQIIIDSFIRSDANGSYPYAAVSTIEYDAAGRVVKETIVNIKNGESPLQPTRRPTYTYDNRGNLGVLGWKSSSYDYKINPLRQSPVFQFILRNYSMNNAAVQSRYNSLGLPLSMNPSNDLFFNGIVTPKVIYDCQ